MSAKTFLHELADFGDLIGAVSREKSILPQLIEKITGLCTLFTACSNRDSTLN